MTTPATRAKSRKPDTDHCVGCGSDNLFSGYFDPETELAVTQSVWSHDDPAVYMTFCNECGERQS